MKGKLGKDNPAYLHGMRNSPEYDVWHAMKQRCLNPEHASYDLYGGRGITVCERWLSFENFYADMGPRPDGMTLERDNNNRGYQPDNCRWATRLDQANNRRGLRCYIYNGERKSLSQLSRISGIGRKTLEYRLKSGWQLSRAMTEPIRW